MTVQGRGCDAARVKDRLGDELIVIGHSMGGVVLLDILTCYGKDIPVDMLITVGSSRYPTHDT
ncbi:MAG TPA: hypothetical protein V6D08_03995 [Candidatus Obscuribacterales bacterium]